MESSHCPRTPVPRTRAESLASEGTGEWEREGEKARTRARRDDFSLISHENGMIGELTTLAIIGEQETRERPFPSLAVGGGNSLKITNL
jgi:hypothetical protein